MAATVQLVPVESATGLVVDITLESFYQAIRNKGVSGPDDQIIVNGVPYVLSSLQIAAGSDTVQFGLDANGKALFTGVDSAATDAAADALGVPIGGLYFNTVTGAYTQRLV